MNKIIKISIIAIFVLAIAILVLWSVSKNRENQTQEQAQSQISGTLSAGQLPGGSQIPVQDSAIRVEKLDDRSQIQKAYKDYVYQNLSDLPATSQEGISTDYPVNDNSGNMVELGTFLSSIGANINPQILNLVGSNYYGMFYCVNKDGKREYGIAMDAGKAETPSDLQRENAEIRESMKKWEPYLLKDLHGIIFPSDSLSESDLNQAINFKDGAFRYTDVIISGKNNSINYAVKNDEGNFINRIYITSSQDCLNKALRNLFDY